MKHVAYVAPSPSSPFGAYEAQCSVTGAKVWYGVAEAVRTIGPARLDEVCRGEHVFYGDVEALRKGAR